VGTDHPWSAGTRLHPDVDIYPTGALRDRDRLDQPLSRVFFGVEVVGTEGPG
jgi:hypothetical protein